MFVRMTEGEVAAMREECAYSMMMEEKCHDCYWGAVCAVVAPGEVKPYLFVDADIKRCVNGGGDSEKEGRVSKKQED